MMTLQWNSTSLVALYLTLSSIWMMVTPILIVVGQPEVTSFWVNPDPVIGMDQPTCGHSSSTPCLSLKYTLSLLPPLGATIWLDSGRYLGENNTNLALGSIPVHVRSIHGPGTVILDAEHRPSTRHMDITLTSGTGNMTYVTIEGLTFEGGYASSAGSIQVNGWWNTKMFVQFIDCVFQNNVVVGDITQYITAGAGALFFNDVNFQNSQDSMYASPAFYPTERADTSITFINDQQPLPTYNTPTMLVTPERPYDTFVPAAIVRGCLFTNNTYELSTISWLTLEETYAAALATVTSFIMIDSCTFIDHPLPAVFVIMQFASYSSTFYGAIWIHNSRFERNAATAFMVNDGYDGVGGPTLLVTDSVFEGGQPHQMDPTRWSYDQNSFIGKYNPRVVIQHSTGDVTLINNTISGGSGTIFSLSGTGVFRFFDGSISQLDVTIAPLMYIKQNQIAPLFIRSTFSEIIGSSGSVMGGLTKSVLPHFIDCTFSSNRASGSGGVFDLSIAPDGTCLFIINSTFINNAALIGGVISQSATTSQFSIINSTFSSNIAIREGGVIYQSSTSSMVSYCDSCQFILNTGSSGGAIGIGDGGAISITNSFVSSNRAYLGGGVWTQTTSLFGSTNSVFFNNTALESGGAIYDAVYLSYINTTFIKNSAALMGGAIYFPTPKVPVEDIVLPDLILSQTILRQNCSTMMSGVSFDSNTAGGYGGAFQFDISSNHLKCNDFCTIGPITANEAEASSSGVWSTTRCSFKSNTAGASYGALFGGSLHHAGLLVGSSTDSATTTTTATIYPGLSFSLEFQLFDELNRTYLVSGGGSNGATLKLELFQRDSFGHEFPIDVVRGTVTSDITQTSMMNSDSNQSNTTEANTYFSQAITAVEGMVTFPNLRLYTLPSTGGSTATSLIVRARSDRSSMSPIEIELLVEPCPTTHELRLSPLDDPSVTSILLPNCVLRPLERPLYEHSTSLPHIFIGVTLFLVVTMAIFMFILFLMRERSIMKNTSHLFTQLSIFGCMIICVSVIPRVLVFKTGQYHSVNDEPHVLNEFGQVINMDLTWETFGRHSASCEKWLINLGYYILVGALLVKTRRVALIFNQKQMTVIKYASDGFLLLQLIGLVLGEIGVMIGLELGDQYRFNLKTYNLTHDYYVLDNSSGDWIHSYSFIVVYIFRFLILLPTCIYTFQVRNIPAAFNETLQLLVTVYNLAFLSILLPIIEASVDQSTDKGIIAHNVAVWFIAVTCAAIIIGPKLKYVNSILTGNENNSMVGAGVTGLTSSEGLPRNSSSGGKSRPSGKSGKGSKTFQNGGDKTASVVPGTNGGGRSNTPSERLSVMPSASPTRSVTPTRTYPQHVLPPTTKLYAPNGTIIRSPNSTTIEIPLVSLSRSTNSITGIEKPMNSNVASTNDASIVTVPHVLSVVPESPRATGSIASSGSMDEVDLNHPTTQTTTMNCDRNHPTQVIRIHMNESSAPEIKGDSGPTTTGVSSSDTTKEMDTTKIDIPA